MITADYSKNELPQSIKKGAGTNDVIILYCYGGTHTQDRNNLSLTDMRSTVVSIKRLWQLYERTCRPFRLLLSSLKTHFERGEARKGY